MEAGFALCSASSGPREDAFVTQSKTQRKSANVGFACRIIAWYGTPWFSDAVPLTAGVSPVPGTPLTSSGHFRGPHAGPAQQRYGEYFGRVLYSPLLRDPEQPTVMLSQIVFNGFELLNMSAGDSLADSGGQWLEDDSAPFLVVFQYGRSVWAGFPETRVMPMSYSCFKLWQNFIILLLQLWLILVVVFSQGGTSFQSCKCSVAVQCAHFLGGPVETGSCWYLSQSAVLSRCAGGSCAV
jgi:hypothetical protein